LIKYDKHYLTNDAFQLNQTLSYLIPFLNKNKYRSFIDIGCGQGELVEYLRHSGRGESVGFDPTYKGKDKYIIKDYYNEKNLRKLLRSEFKEPKLFILRCVLPHIKDPFKFVDKIFEDHLKSNILIEFQNLNWIFKNRIFSSISHDHVNYFSLDSFNNKYDVKSKGTFSSGEWSYVLLGKKYTSINKSSQELDLNSNLKMLLSYKKLELEFLVNNYNSIYLYGAAAKGMNYALSLQNKNFIKITAIDMNPSKQNHFMEVSGIKVLSPEHAKKKMNRGSVIVVMNPNHYEFAKELFPKTNLFTAGSVL
jgi:SAM-dependent methyltransferase